VHLQYRLDNGVCHLFRLEHDPIKELPFEVNFHVYEYCVRHVINIETNVEVFRLKLKLKPNS